MPLKPLTATKLSYRSPWFWGIPVVALTAMLLIGITGSNQSLFLVLNELLYFRPEAIWLNITLYGDAAMVMVLLLPLVNRRPDIIVKGFIAALVGAVILLGIKQLLMIPRPPAVLESGSFHQIGNLFTQASFPSGHSGAVFTLASVIIFMVDDTKIRSLVLAYAILIALSRIAIGAHWPMDILGGAFFGWLATFLSMYFIPVTGKNRWAQRIFTFLLLFAVIHLVFLHKAGDIEARFLEVLTPIICFLLSLKGLNSLYLEPVIKRIK